MEPFSKKKKEESPPEELTPEIQAKLVELSEKGTWLEKEGRVDDALKTWQEGLALIPEPKQLYGEAVWFLTTIGDVYFLKGMYSQAHEYFDKARGNLSGEDDGRKYFDFLRTHIDLDKGKN